MSRAESVITPSPLKSSTNLQNIYRQLYIQRLHIMNTATSLQSWWWIRAWEACKQLQYVWYAIQNRSMHWHTCSYTNRRLHLTHYSAKYHTVIHLTFFWMWMVPTAPLPTLTSQALACVNIFPYTWEELKSLYNYNCSPFPKKLASEEVFRQLQLWNHSFTP